MSVRDLTIDDVVISTNPHVLYTLNVNDLYTIQAVEPIDNPQNAVKLIIYDAVGNPIDIDGKVLSMIEPYSNTVVFQTADDPEYLIKSEMLKLAKELKTNITESISKGDSTTMWEEIKVTDPFDRGWSTNPQDAINALEELGFRNVYTDRYDFGEVISFEDEYGNEGLVYIDRVGRNTFQYKVVTPEDMEPEEKEYEFDPYDDIPDDVDPNDVDECNLSESISDKIIKVGLYGDYTGEYESLDQMISKMKKAGLTVEDLEGDEDYGWEFNVTGPAKVIYKMVDDKIPGYSCDGVQEFVDMYEIDVDESCNEDYSYDDEEDTSDDELTNSDLSNIGIYWESDISDETGDRVYLCKLDGDTDGLNISEDNVVAVITYRDNDGDYYYSVRFRNRDIEKGLSRDYDDRDLDSIKDWVEKQVRTYILREDTIRKSNGKWTNKGKDGEHGEFTTKKAADAQRKAMFANGYKESINSNTELYDDLDEALEDDPELPDQEYTSADTSISYKNGKLPVLFNLVDFKDGTLNLDYGGGKFDDVSNYLQTKGVTSLVYDPYNRSIEHNRDVLDTIRQEGGADTVTCSNVLNVIKEPEARLAVIRNCRNYLKPDGVAYFTVYRDSKKSEGPSGGNKYQLHRKEDDYVSEIEQVFDNVTRKGRLIIAR